MKRKVFLFLIILLVLTGCSLSEDVTPPPELATRQAAEQLPQATQQRPAPEPQATQAEEISAPEGPPDLSQGEQLYLENCETCHGLAGLGDGVMSANLDVQPSPLGDPAFASSVLPYDWYLTVTQGRMERFMPPFVNLSDAQRWDVVAYALSLSVSSDQLERGEVIYQETCTDCHGERGDALAPGVDLRDVALFTDNALDDYYTVITQGKGSMPALEGALDESDRFAAAAYVRTLAFSEDTAAEPATDVSTGAIYGSIENGTEGADLPHGLEVTFFAFEGNQLVFEKEILVDADGKFEVQDLEIVPGRIFGATTEYQGVRYFNTAGHMLEDNLSLELPLTVFETTTDDSLIVVDRLHLILDYSIEGVVEVSELLLMTNTGDRTIAGQDGFNDIRVTLPKDFSNLQFADSPELMRFTEDADGFVMHEAFIPGEAVETYFSFTLPYERSLEYQQPVDYPVEAIVILKTQGPPSISGEGLSEVGARDMGGIFMESYRMDPLERGEILELRLSGSHPARVDSSSTTNLIIGAAALGLTLIVIFFAWWKWSQGHEPTVKSDIETAPEEPRDREALIRAIAALDDMNEAGEVTGKAYRERREALKRKLKALIESEHD
ncbi:MAG: c-type cytochrome [Anaerolineales bacterium]|nr:MAG: c-type cytochrome [Anaerolineales bacterium]